MPDLHDEATLRQALRQGHTRQAAFTDLTERYGRRLYWHIRRMVVVHEDAQDLLQETFIKAFDHCDSLRGDSALYTWLYRIATNECLMWLRKKRTLLGSTASIEDTLIEQLPCQMEETAEDMLIRFKTAVLQLPPKQQLVFNLRYYDELSYEDIARITDQQVGTLKVNYHYAVKYIKQQLSTESIT